MNIFISSVSVCVCVCVWGGGIFFFLFVFLHELSVAFTLLILCRDFAHPTVKHRTLLREIPHTGNFYSVKMCDTKEMFYTYRCCFQIL